MEFVTIHDLSRELNVPARVIRYRLIQAIAEGKLKEHEDFRRDEFKDDQHFLWKIHPLSFMSETGLKPDSPVNQIDANLITSVNNTGNQSSNFKPEPLKPVNQRDNNVPPSVTKTTHVDNKEPSLEREMIDLLKDQIKVKDGQLHEQGEQLKDLNDLNVKLTGTMLQQNQKIENLLRLTGGKSEVISKESGSVDQPRDQAEAEETVQAA